LSSSISPSLSFSVGGRLVAVLMAAWLSHLSVATLLLAVQIQLKGPPSLSHSQGRRHNFKSGGTNASEASRKCFGLYPHICHSGGTTATKRGIPTANRTALLQYLTDRARAILASI